jgi:hypothetical protein
MSLRTSPACWRGVAALQLDEAFAKILTLGSAFGKDQRAQPGALDEEQAQVRQHDELQLLAHRRLARQAGLDGRDDLVVPVLDDPHAQLALAAEIGEDCGLGHPQALGDLGGRRAFVAALGEHLAADAQDVAHALLGLGAGGRTALGRGNGCGRHRRAFCAILEDHSSGDCIRIRPALFWRPSRGSQGRQTIKLSRA